MARKRRSKNKPPMTTQPQPSAGVSVSGAESPTTSSIDTKPFIAAIEKKIPPQLMPIFKMIVLKGDVQMFSQETHEMTLDQLKKPGPMAPKLAEGIAALMYILFQKSNKTLPPQLLEPAGVVLLCHAFDFLQKAASPDANKQTLGDAVDQFQVAIHNALGVTPEQFNQAVAAHGQPQPGVLGAQP